MSQIKLDSISISGLLPIEPLLPDPNLLNVQPAPSESFDDHLHRAGARPDETSISDSPDSAAADAVRNSDTGTQPAGDDRSRNPQNSTDAQPQTNSAEQATPEDAAENDGPEANEAQTDASEPEQPETAEDGLQTPQKQKTDDAEAGEVKVVVDVDQLPDDTSADAADDPAGMEPTSEHHWAEHEKENQKGLQRAAEKQPMENARPGRQILAKETPAKETPAKETLVKEALVKETLVKETVTEDGAPAQSAREEKLPADPNVVVLDEAVEQETDDAGEKVTQRAADRTAAGKHPHTATSHGRPEKQADGADETGDQIQQHEPQASQTDAPRRPQRQSGKQQATFSRAGKGPPQQPTQNAAAAHPAATPRADPQTLSSQQTASTGEEKAEASETAAKPVSSGTAESQSNLPTRAGPNQASRSGSPQQPHQATEPGQVDRVRFVQRVARAFQAMGDRGGSVRLRLSPPELGSLRLEITVRNGMMTARVEAETQTARNLLLDNLPMLRDRLAQQDVKVEQFNVDLADRSPGGLPEQTAEHAQSHDRGESNNAPRPGADGESEGESTPDPGAARRPGEGTQLNVVV